MTDAALLRRESVLPKAIVLLGIAIGLAILGFLVRYAAYRFTLPAESGGDFLRVLCRWDCEWYVRMAETGYDSFPTAKMINAGNWAFFPLYPLLIGLLKSLTGMDTLPLAALVSMGLGVLTSLVAWPLLGRNLRAYTLFATFILCGPFSFYFTTFFTESLFILLTLAVFSALKSRNFLLAGLLAAALSATRIVGVFIVFAMLWEVWIAHRERGGTWRDFVPDTLKRPDIVLSFAIAPLGLFAYMLYLHLHIGDALAFQHVQRAWGRPSGLPPVFIFNGFLNGPGSGFLPTSSQWLALASVIAYGLIAALVWRGWFGMAIFAAIALTLPLFAGLASMTRFVAAMGPFPLLLAEVMGKTRWRFFAGMAVLLVGAFYMTIAWLYWVTALV